MSSYLIKPREPTALLHEEYYELPSTNLLVPLVVRPPLLHDIPRNYADSWSRATGPDRPHNSRYLDYRKVQHRTRPGLVELSPPRRETSETGYTRRTWNVRPCFFPSLASNQSRDVDSVDELECPRIGHRQRHRRDLPNGPHLPTNHSPCGLSERRRNHQHRRGVGRTTVQADDHSVHQVEFHFDRSVLVACLVYVLPRPSPFHSSC